MTAALPITVSSAIDAYRRGWRRGWHVPEPLTVWEWADKHRVLTRETSKEPGPWRTARTPQLREPMEALSIHYVCRTVTCCFPTQNGKTEIILNFCGYVIHHTPAPLISVQPTGDMALRWSRQRLDVMVRETPALKDRIRTARTKDSNNTAKMKQFPGGFIIVAQAESPTSMASMPARFSVLDEVDSYPVDSGKEGDPIEIAERRTDSYDKRAKNLRVSSPKKLMGASLIWREYLAGDQSQYHVPCPHCGEYQIMVIDNLLETGQYLCEANGCTIDHSDKTEMLDRGKWIAKYPDRSQTHRSFHSNALYTPVGLGPSWSDLHKDREAAKDSPIKQKTFDNTRLAIPFEPKEGRIEAKDLENLKEDWSQREIPPGVLILTAAVDVQKNRFHVKIIGYSRGPQLWVIDRMEIPGSPLEPESWQDLDDYLSQPIQNAWGIDMLPRLIAVDSGAWAKEAVYNEVRQRNHKGWIAVKGHNTTGKPIIGRPTYVDVSVMGRTLKRGLKLYMIGVDTAKDTLLERLALAAAKEHPEQRWFHLPKDIHPDWFEQITAERRDPATDRWEKVKPNARNEDIDTLVYNYAAACHPRINIHRMREADWQRMEEEIQPPTPDLFSKMSGQDAPQSTTPIPVPPVRNSPTVPAPIPTGDPWLTP